MKVCHLHSSQGFPENEAAKAVAKREATPSVGIIVEFRVLSCWKCIYLTIIRIPLWKVSHIPKGRLKKKLWLIPGASEGNKACFFSFHSCVTLSAFLIKSSNTVSARKSSSKDCIFSLIHILITIYLSWLTI